MFSGVVQRGLPARDRYPVNKSTCSFESLNRNAKPLPFHISVDNSRKTLYPLCIMPSGRET